MKQIEQHNIIRYGLVSAKLEPLAYGFTSFSHSEELMLTIAERESFTTQAVVILIADNDPLPLAVFVAGILYKPALKTGPDND